MIFKKNTVDVGFSHLAKHVKHFLENTYVVTDVIIG